MEFGRLARRAGVSLIDVLHDLLLALGQQADSAFRVSCGGQDAHPPFTPKHTRRTPRGARTPPLLLLPIHWQTGRPTLDRSLLGPYFPIHPRNQIPKSRPPIVFPC